VSAVLPRVTELSKTTKIVDKQRLARNELAARSLGVHVVGYAPPIPSKHDAETLEAGAEKRLCKKMPDQRPIPMREIRSHCRYTCHKLFTPISRDYVFDVDEWLATTHYSEQRKDQLRGVWFALVTGLNNMVGKVYRKMKRFIVDCFGKTVDEDPSPLHFSQHPFHTAALHWDDKYYKNKSFIKAESYPTYKHARWINSRSDQFKVLTGPVFKAIEKEVFKLPCFIKKIPVMDRAKYINDMMGQLDGTFIATDYSSFERAFNPAVVKAVEMQMYKYMMKNHPEMWNVVEIIEKGLTSDQLCGASSVRVKTQARMSGDMCTSLGNGFTNFLIMSYWAHKNNFEFCGVVEGDDGLFRVPSEDLIPPSEFYNDLGFEIKLVRTDRLNEGGFCKLYYAPDEPENLQDPIPVVLRTGWTLSSKMHGGPGTMRELLRAKGFSLMCETPHCPIITAMAKWIMRITEGSEIAAPETWWEHERWRNYDAHRATEKLISGPTIGQRCFVERFWGIAIEDQLEIENWFDNSKVIEPITCPKLLDYAAGFGVSDDDSTHCQKGYSDWFHSYHTRLVHQSPGTAW
jgi:hypothetical protein